MGELQFQEEFELHEELAEHIGLEKAREFRVYLCDLEAMTFEGPCWCSLDDLAMAIVEYGPGLDLTCASLYIGDDDERQDPEFRRDAGYVSLGTVELTRTQLVHAYLRHVEWYGANDECVDCLVDALDRKDEEDS